MIKHESVTDRLLICHRDDFRLEVHRWSDRYRRFIVASTYPVAVGLPDYQTEPGVYTIYGKVVNPDWRMPYSDWVQPPELRGTVVPGGDDANPIRARWMPFGAKKTPAAGQGLHGTWKEDSIGTRASHGCIRLTVPDVKELYDQVIVTEEKGTRLVIL